MDFSYSNIFDADGLEQSTSGNDTSNISITFDKKFADGQELDIILDTLYNSVFNNPMPTSVSSSNSNDNTATSTFDSDTTFDSDATINPLDTSKTPSKRNIRKTVRTHISQPTYVHITSNSQRKHGSSIDFLKKTKSSKKEKEPNLNFHSSNLDNTLPHITKGIDQEEKEVMIIKETKTTNCCIPFQMTKSINELSFSEFMNIMNSLSLSFN